MPMSVATRRVTTAVVLATTVVVVVAVYLGRRDAALPEPSMTPVGITAHATDIRTVPDVSPKARKDVADILAATLRLLYTRAFTATLQATPSTSPTPGPARRLKSLMTKPAVAALKKSPGVFDLGELVVTNGAIVFSGLVTFDGKEPYDALLDVEFVGRATPLGMSTPVARVHQEGTIGLRRSPVGWLIDSFDLRFATKPQPTPTPTSSPG
jgi:hypothetical protein